MNWRNIMVKIGIFYWFGYPIEIKRRFALIKEKGFYSVTLWWGDEYKEIDGDKLLLPDLARKAGLYVENVHAPFGKANDIWKDSLDGLDLVKQYTTYIEECKKSNINTIVIHTPIKKEQLINTEIGINRLKHLAEYANNAGVVIAVENVRRIDSLQEIYSKINMKSLGFCYDSGHENCYNKGSNIANRFKDKIVAIHLHDNDETADQHRILGEGNINWDIVRKNINKSSYEGSIILEVTNEFSIKHENSNIDTFLSDAYNKAISFFG